MSILLGQETRV